MRVHRFERGRAEALLALDETGRPVGVALFCPHVSTFLGRAGLYLRMDSSCLHAAAAARARRFCRR